MVPRLVLFDIDGTLLKPFGVGRRSLEKAFSARFGRQGAFDGVRFHGRTDPEIIRDGLRAIGEDAALTPEVLDLYIEQLDREVSAAPPLYLPGVVEVLDALAAIPGLCLGLVTGNVRRGARIKLARDGVWDRFRTGAFGEESDDRGALVRIARERAGALTGHDFGPGRVFHVGDTEADVVAARRGEAVAIAVSTGGEPHEALAALAPDHLFASLQPMQSFLDAVLRP